MADRLRIPASRCPACGHVSRDFETIDKRCEQVLEGVRCRGIKTGEHSYDDWQACSACGATGRLNRARCGECRGDGWIFARTT